MGEFFGVNSHLTVTKCIDSYKLQDILHKHISSCLINIFFLAGNKFSLGIKIAKENSFCYYISVQIIHRLLINLWIKSIIVNKLIF